MGDRSQCCTSCDETHLERDFEGSFNSFIVVDFNEFLSRAAEFLSFPSHPLVVLFGGSPPSLGDVASAIDAPIFDGDVDLGEGEVGIVGVSVHAYVCPGCLCFVLVGNVMSEEKVSNDPFSNGADMFSLQGSVVEIRSERRGRFVFFAVEVEDRVQV